MSEQSLLEALRAYGASGVCPMHMPGHKRNAALLGDALPYGIDVTEVEGFDNLQNPEGILLRTEALAAKLYGSRRAFLSVNGSTGALLAAVYACARPYEKVILARNSHRSVYAALEIRLLRPVYLPEPVDGATGIAGSVSPSSVRAALAANPTPGSSSFPRPPTRGSNATSAASPKRRMRQASPSSWTRRTARISAFPRPSGKTPSAPARIWRS